MTSKRKLRAEIERLRVSRAGYRTALLDAAAECTCPALGVATPAVQQPWAKHLARVTDAAREQGRREGWTQAWAAGARADEDAYRRGWEDAVADATLAAGDDAVSLPIRVEHTTGRVDPDNKRVWLTGPDGRELDFVPPSWPLGPQPQPETTPEPHGEPDGPCCGFACCCQHPPVAGWAPGSVTR